MTVGEQQIKEFRKNRTYQRILVIIDSVIVYSTYMILWSVLSLFEFVVRHLLLIRAQVIDGAAYYCRVCFHCWLY